MAQFITQHETIRTGTRFLLYPLIGILRVGAVLFYAIPSNLEATAFIAGLLVSSLIGLTYAALPLAAVLSRTSRGRRFARRLEKPTSALLLGSVLAVAVAELSGLLVLMTLATAIAVLAALVSSAFLGSRALLTLIGQFRLGFVRER